jgi:AbrB family looped-hinge helix DNA binding protein
MVVRGRTRVTRKGQITIPAHVRRALGLSEGDAIEVQYDEVTQVATFSSPESLVRRTAGILKRPGQPVLSEEELKRAINEAAQAAALERDERSKRG